MWLLAGIEHHKLYLMPASTPKLWIFGQLVVFWLNYLEGNLSSLAKTSWIRYKG